MKNSSTRLHIKSEAASSKAYNTVRRIIDEYNLNTVCQSAACPNIFECFGAKTSTFMILGNKCTRNCSFCLIESGRDLTVDLNEPYRVAEAVLRLGLKYSVVTSVTRDDLKNGGASVFANTISWIRKLNPKCLIEVLTPDFQGNKKALSKIIDAAPNVFNHNLETVSRLHPEIKPQADYKRSLNLLETAKNAGLIVKSGLMIGLGENQREIINTMQDLRKVGCDILTIGQYLRPTPAHHEVKKFYRVDEFSFLKQVGLAMNYKVVESMPLVRSSYKAHQSYQKVIEIEKSLRKAG